MGVVGHRSGPWWRRSLHGSGGARSVRTTAEQVEQVALAAGPVTGAGAGPIEHQIEVRHQLGPVRLGLETIEGTAMDQGLDRPAVELLARDPVAEIGQVQEGAAAGARLDQLADGAITEVADGRETKEDLLAHGVKSMPEALTSGGITSIPIAWQLAI